MYKPFRSNDDEMSIAEDFSENARIDSDAGMICVWKKLNLKHSNAFERFSTFPSKTFWKNDFRSGFT